MASEEDAAPSFNQQDWEEEQRRLASMFTSMYGTAHDADAVGGAPEEVHDSDAESDAAEDAVDENALSRLNRLPIPDLMPFMLEAAEGDEYAGSAARLLEDGAVVPWRPPGTFFDEMAEKGVAPDFVAKAKGLSPLARALLMGEMDPADCPADELLHALGRGSDTLTRQAMHKSFDVMRVPGALSAEACERLRAAVDHERCTAADSVDGLPEHQLRLSRERLEQLVGAEACARLLQLPVEYVHAENAHLDPGGSPVDDAMAARFSRLEECFIRRYSADTRPWNNFHQDRARITVNVAVSSDDGHGGGRLLGVYAGRVHPLERSEGDATVHSSDLFHGVTRMTRGERYSLIMFFDPDGVEEMFHARIAGVRNRNVRRFLAHAFVPSSTESSGMAHDLSRLLLK
jgi:predicted 2-oxoglutarate/Fe(II)-dependent dioxygenase YbiX